MGTQGRVGTWGMQGGHVPRRRGPWQHLWLLLHVSGAGSRRPEQMHKDLLGQLLMRVLLLQPLLLG